MAQAAGANFATYTLGWTVQDFEGEKLIWHGGNTDGMSAAVGFVPSQDIGAVMLTNMNQALLPYPLMLRVLDQLTDGEPVDWAGRLLEQAEQINAQGRSAGPKSRLGASSEPRHRSPWIDTQAATGTASTAMRW
jgi:hypothetical protein